MELPELTADGSCPVSEVEPLGNGRVLGPGPVHPVAGQAVLLGLFSSARSEEGWYRFKTLWIITADYDGAVLIRGVAGRGPGELRFQRGTGSTSEPSLHLPANQSWAYGAGYGDSRQFPSTTNIDSRGCYAWQVDGEGFSHHVVFSAQEPSVTAPDWSRARYLSRSGDVLLIVLEGKQQYITIDLGHVAVFDCRSDCFSDIGAGLEALRPDDELCIGFLYLQDGRQAGKVWVNRYTCEAGGRVIPP
ncbi:MAG: hypothetical protein GEU75_10580 [Dehalococcoidia bacterium]|nr:hypothetical protein [Dehalococcoidia bacterium]